MKRRSLFVSVVTFTLTATFLGVAILCGRISSSRAEQPSKRTLLKDGQELNRLSEQEKTLLSPDKQSAQKTIAGLSVQVEVLQMQQDKLVEELLKYRRLVRESKRDDDVVPAFSGNDQTPEKGLTRREKELKAELRKEQERGVKLEKEIAQQEKIQDRRTSKREEELDSELKEERNRTTKLEKELSDLQERFENARKNMTRAEGIEQQLHEKDAHAEQLEAELQRYKPLEKINAELRADLERSKHQIEELEASIRDQAQLVGGIPALRKQLQEAKNELLMKQTEIQMLAKASSGNAALASAAAPKPVVTDAAKQKILDEVMERSGRIAGEETVKGKASTNNVLIIEVRAAKGNLRAGPGDEHAPVMQVRRGTRLTVEQREGDWYRVIAPTGERAYIMAEVVAPVKSDGSGGAGRGPAKQVARAVPPDDSFETFGNVKPPSEKPKDDVDRAFQKLQKGAADPNVVGPERE